MQSNYKLRIPGEEKSKIFSLLLKLHEENIKTKTKKIAEKLKKIAASAKLIKPLEARWEKCIQAVEESKITTIPDFYNQLIEKAEKHFYLENRHDRTFGWPKSDDNLRRKISTALTQNLFTQIPDQPDRKSINSLINIISNPSQIYWDEIDSEKIRNDIE